MQPWLTNLPSSKLYSAANICINANYLKWDEEKWKLIQESGVFQLFLNALLEKLEGKYSFSRFSFKTGENSYKQYQIKVLGDNSSSLASSRNAFYSMP